MIVLDTNVVSEPMKSVANPAVQAWLNAQVAETLFLTSTALSELLAGVELLPDGKRKKGLAAALTDLITRLFGPRILPFDRDAAIAYAKLIKRARDRGYSPSVPDAQIAAIATVRQFTVATRDINPFLEMDVPIINPWTESESQ